MRAGVWTSRAAATLLALSLGSAAAATAGAPALAEEQDRERPAATTPAPGPTESGAARAPEVKHFRAVGLAIDQTVRLLHEAERRSPTIRHMMAALDRSDLIVYVRLEPVLGDRRGCLTFVTVSGRFRMLLISISIGNFADDRIKWLAHEMAHALEVSEAPEVRDSASLARFFQRAGWPTSERGSSYETARAQEVGFRVQGELVGRK